MQREVDNYHCGSCKYFKVNADREESTCKRIDHKKIQFTIPWFKSYDCGQFSGVVCSDFIPADWHIDAVKNWTTFEEYWDNFVEQWLPYCDMDTLYYFTINGDKDMRYGIPLRDYVYGTMWEGNKFKAVEKVYYKKDKDSKGSGRKIVRERIDGVIIE